MMVKELLDAKIISADVILTDSELQSKYMDHLFDLMGEESRPLSQPIISTGEHSRPTKTTVYSLYQIAADIMEFAWIVCTN